MITACFARALQRCAGCLYMGFRFIFQAVRQTGKTRNQLRGSVERISRRSPLRQRHVSLPCEAGGESVWPSIVATGLEVYVCLCTGGECCTTLYPLAGVGES